MKKILFSLLVLASGFAAKAQYGNDRYFKPFKVDLSLGFALPMGGEGNARGGGIFAVEPKYALADQFALGLRMEMAAMARVITNDPAFEGEGDVVANLSYLFTGDYYFNNNNFRPFLGAGTGLYVVGAAPVDENTTPEDVLTANRFGFMLRGGFEAGHFRLGLEYNMVGKTDFSAHNNYLGFKLGVCIGGGRYK